MRSLPVVAYHQVNNLPEDIMEREFYAHMEFLAQKGYRTVFLKDWVRGDVVADDKTVAITFDDGYLDNWVYAYPALKKFGHRATIFICTARTADGLPPRANLEDVWAGRCDRNSLPPDISLWDSNRRCAESKMGSPEFLSWEELQTMQASGLVDIQSHSQYHRDYFFADQILDFNQNQPEYFNLCWWTDGDARWGIPIYPRRSALAERRYFDDVGLRDHMAAYVRGPEFFSGRQRREWLPELMAAADEYRSTHKPNDRYESVEECERRIAEELAVSKRTIEEKLGKNCEVICWPWGGYNETSVRLARQVGYKGAVAFAPGVNLKGTEGGTWSVKRFSAPRDVEGLVHCLAIYGSPVRAAVAGCQKRWQSQWGRIKQRIRDRQVLGAVRRKLAETALRWWR